MSKHRNLVLSEFTGNFVMKEFGIFISELSMCSNVIAN